MRTDGLVESRTPDVDEGIAARAIALRRLGSVESAGEVADGLLQAMGTVAAGRTRTCSLEPSGASECRGFDQCAAIAPRLEGTHKAGRPLI